jgi:hypothetical protein
MAIHFPERLRFQLKISPFSSTVFITNPSLISFWEQWPHGKDKIGFPWGNGYVPLNEYYIYPENLNWTETQSYSDQGLKETLDFEFAYSKLKI